ncbi:hypothetical protein ROLI_016030 [Roseobacter fucihabitans]|uniref:Lipoprotein n=2 Tax=Roseobacter fucihabitans TaxID=1537242 RepID=A0ABZ2BTI4_9RHOB|nr:hypothetical protein [Roseobacter litoralis]
MNSLRLPIHILWIFGLAFMVLAGCERLADPYSAEAYKQATSLKARSLALVAKGTEPYSKHEQMADALLIDAASAFEFAKGRGKEASQTAAKQWAIIVDPNGGSLGDFVAQWRKAPNQRMGQFFVDEFSEILSVQFDRIIELETGRRSTSSGEG